MEEARQARAAVSAVVEAVGADAVLVEKLGQVVVPALVFAQPMHDHRYTAVSVRHLAVQVQLRAVEG
mgnify:CR=1 FL=1